MSNLDARLARIEEVSVGHCSTGRAKCDPSKHSCNDGDAIGRMRPDTGGRYPCAILPEKKNGSHLCKPLNCLVAGEGFETCSTRWIPIL